MAHLFLVCLRVSFKKNPALTTPQARQLIATALDEHIPALDIASLLKYRQTRNRAAYVSHRKRTRAKYRLSKNAK